MDVVIQSQNVACENIICDFRPSRQPGQRVAQGGHVLVGLARIGGNGFVRDAAKHAGFVAQAAQLLLFFDKVFSFCGRFAILVPVCGVGISTRAAGYTEPPRCMIASGNARKREGPVHMMTIREYKRAESLEEAWQLNQKKQNRILGGMIWLKMETINVGTAIDLSGLRLDTIEETEEAFSIGAMVTLRQLEQHPGLQQYTQGALREAVRHIVGVQLRNLATVGGSIYSRFGFSDVLTIFLAMDCDVELYKGGIIPLREYAQRPYDRDVLVRLIVKKEKAAFYYQSVRNSQTDIPVLTCAAARTAGGEYRVVIGARPLRAVRFDFPAQTGLSAQQLAAELAAAVQAQTVTGSNMRGSAEYRKHLTGVLTKRAVLELEQRNGQEEA